MDYHTVWHFSQTWGLVLLVILFIGAVGYAFWPKNREKFKQAAQIPLEGDDDFSEPSNIDNHDRDADDR